LKLPINVVISNVPWGNLLSWLENNVNKGDVAYTWPVASFAFENDEDAAAFLLVFGGKRKYTTIEQMIRNIDETC
jgi:hypothetical protein